GAGSVRDRSNPIEVGRFETRAGGIVRIADDDQPGTHRHQTLERSGIDAPPRASALIEDERPLDERAAEGAREAPRLHVVGHHHHHFVARLDETPRRDVVDRKSTRLNSSHRTISYAVFCLKKKNIITSEISSSISRSRRFLI